MGRTLDSFVAATRIASVVIAAAVLVLACNSEAPSPVNDEPPTVPADDLPSSVVPPAAAPARTSATPEMTSYEVAIAIAAANRKKAESDCAARPAVERRACLDGVATEWDTTRTALEDLRGEPQ
jgi:hypothetical protein